MAEKERKYYADGSLAYEITQPVEEEYFYSVDPSDLPDAPELDAPLAEAVPVPRQSISPGAVLGAVAAVVMLVMLMMAQVRMSIANKDVLALENQVKALQAEQDDLEIRYETAFNLTELEDYAVNELGMQKPRSDQIYYINGTAEDRTVILDESARESSWVDRVGDFFCSIAEYFS